MHKYLLRIHVLYYSQLHVLTGHAKLSTFAPNLKSVLDFAWNYSYVAILKNYPCTCSYSVSDQCELICMCVLFWREFNLPTL